MTSSDSERKPLVLVIDDDADFRDRIIPKALERALGVRTIKAANATEAKDQYNRHHILSQDPIDLVVLDMHMPESAHDGALVEKGLEILEWVKRLGWIGIPVVVFTAFATFGNCVKSMHLGTRDYVPKMPMKHTLGPTQPITEGGTDDLIAACKRLL